VKLIFLYGPVASGKLTVAREVAAQAGLALFHNHLVVDAVHAVFPFGSEPFVRLRERFWLDVFREAARAGRSLVFTFAPEATVAPDFAERTRAIVEEGGGEVIFVALNVSDEEQERRIDSPTRAAFGKLRSRDLLLELRAQYKASMATMPRPAIEIDTTVTEPTDVAETIIALMRSSDLQSG
jgi:hypothetical protein